jgi:hypothetical protein
MRNGLTGWIDRYLAAREEIVAPDLEFRAWMANKYVPLAGGWLY